MSYAIDRPSPVPSPIGFDVKNGWKSLSLISGPMPVPLSHTRTSTASPRSRVATPQCRLKVGPGAVAMPAGGRVEAAAEQIEKHPGHLLRRQLHTGEVTVELALKSDVEARILGAGVCLSPILSMFLTECPGNSRRAIAGQAAQLLPAGRATIMIPTGRSSESSRSEKWCRFHLGRCDSAS